MSHQSDYDYDFGTEAVVTVRPHATLPGYWEAVNSYGDVLLSTEFKENAKALAFERNLLHCGPRILRENAEAKALMDRATATIDELNKQLGDLQLERHDLLALVKRLRSDIEIADAASEAFKRQSEENLRAADALREELQFQNDAKEVIFAAGEDEIQKLKARVAELEARLTAMEAIG